MFNLEEKEINDLALLREEIHNSKFYKSWYLLLLLYQFYSNSAHFCGIDSFMVMYLLALIWCYKISMHKFVPTIPGGLNCGLGTPGSVFISVLFPCMGGF